jgi:hypothetical protein
MLRPNLPQSDKLTVDYSIGAKHLRDMLRAWRKFSRQMLGPYIESQKFCEMASALLEGSLRLTVEMDIRCNWRCNDYGCYGMPEDQAMCEGLQD